jgi:cell division protein FtsA
VAERIKTKHGGVHATGMDDREMIEIGGDSGDWEKDRRQVSRTELIGIMRPRVEEILEEVRARLDVAGFDTLPSQQIVLTGGASQIPGLDGLASRILGSRVRMGLFQRRRPVPLCRPPAGRMVGLRHSRRALPGAVDQTCLQVVQG